MSKPIIIVEGGQWGSEGKGMVAAALCLQRNIDFAVRTGAVNAGHTVIHKGKTYKMQQLPTGWVNPDTKLVIGAGALIHPDIFYKELEVLGTKPGRLFVDVNAGLHMPEHTDRSRDSGRHHGIGATGKGCSEALCDRIRLRGKEKGRLFRDFAGLHGVEEERIYDWSRTSELLNQAYDEGKSILLEGTQGSALDLYFGPYPFVTHKPTQASTWIQEAGLSPNLKYEIALVVRTYPIRVAGNSGPMENEITWPQLAIAINLDLKVAGKKPLVKASSLLQFEEACMVAAGGFDLPRNNYGLARYDFHLFTPDMREKYKVAISELHAAAMGILKPEVVSDLAKVFEFTTVTKKLRRVSEFNVENVRKAVMLNRPNYLVLSFANYKWPQIWGATVWSDIDDHTKQKMGWAVKDLERVTGVPVRYITTGPNNDNMLEYEDRRSGIWPCPDNG